MVYSLGKFVLFGDSITQHANDQPGFALAPALQSLYTRKLDIVTRGFSGYNTNHTVVTLREVLKAEHAETGIIKVILIFMGTNDAAFNFQGVPIDTYKKNLQAMVDCAQSYNIKVILVGPALHGRAECLEASKTQDIDANFCDSKTTRQYADVAAQVAASNGVPFVDLWSAFQRYGGWSTDDLMSGNVAVGDLLPDGIHFSSEGYKVFYDELVRSVNKGYPELEPSKLPFYYPIYNEVDFDNMEESILQYAKEHTEGA